MRLYTAAQMREADARSTELGMPAGLLMEAAGQRVARSIRRFARCGRVLVLCGTGNNGGDGYVAARFLARDEGRSVRVLELGSSPRSIESRTARAALLAHGLDLRSLASDADGLAGLDDALHWCEVAVDALFGSGLDRALEGFPAEVVRRLNEAPCRRVAVDVPSGVDADRAVPPGPHVRAHLTVQLGGAKVASALYPARAAFGRSVVVDIGLPERALALASGPTLVTRSRARAALPDRAPDAHKYQVGAVLVVAGSEAYPGAAELACRAAYRAGAGLVTLAAPERMPGGWPEVVLEPLDWGAASPLTWLAGLDRKRVRSALIGPGLDPRALPHLPRLLAELKGPVVLDASALTADDALREAVRAHGGCVLTPHLGEGATLARTSVERVRAEPLATATALATAYGAVVALKGATTVIASPDGRVAVSTRGHPGMAVGGSGDVLAGVLAAFLVNGPAFERCCAGVFVHGLAGERAAATRGVGLVADDIVESVPAVMERLANGGHRSRGGRAARFGRLGPA